MQVRMCRPGGGRKNRHKSPSCYVRQAPSTCVHALWDSTAKLLRLGVGGLVGSVRSRWRLRQPAQARAWTTLDAGPWRAARPGCPHHFQVEHQVQLAHVAEVPVQRLHQAVDELQGGQLILQRPRGQQPREPGCLAPNRQKQPRTSSESTPTRKNSEAYRL